MGVGTLLAGGRCYFGDVRWAGAHAAGVLAAAGHVGWRQRQRDLKPWRGTRVAALVSLRDMDVHDWRLHRRSDNQVLGARWLRKGCRPAQHEHH
jgi:hypothetical protein